MFIFGKWHIIGLGILTGAFLFGTALWRAYEAGKTSEQSYTLQETFYAIQKAREARDRANLHELEFERLPNAQPNDPWRRE